MSVNPAIAVPPRSEPPAPTPQTLPTPTTPLKNLPTSEKPSLASHWVLFPSRLTLWFLLLAITALAAFLRFWRISYQSYWTDENRTVERTFGSFERMLQTLGDQGFPPGWYALIRWWTQLVEWYTQDGAFAFSPAGTRSLTALFGTLTIPGLYFLARQFTDRKGALLVALLAAVNPFLIYYSRDIKMYPALWCFLVFHIALFFHWQTTHKHWLYFPLWAITGCLMTATHSVCWFLVALELVFVLTRPRLRPWDMPLTLIGIWAMSLLPVYWYRNGTRWVERVVENGADGGVGWNTRYTDMSWQTLAGLPSSHLLGFLYPSYPPNERITDWFVLGSDFTDYLATRSLPWLASLQWYIIIALFTILLLGLLPWRGLRRSNERLLSVTRGRWWWVALWILLPATALALTWIPPSNPWYDTIWRPLIGDKRLTPVWEPRYLGILVPAWLLWLAASLRRLPTWPLRTLAILSVLTVCTLSSLSNHLLYRQAPWQETADAFLPHFDPQNPDSLVLGTPATAHPGDSDALQFLIARGHRPGKSTAWFLPYTNWNRRIYDGGYASFVRSFRNDARVKTIVLTDRLGDETANDKGVSPHRITNEEIAKRLGPEWKLVYEKKYRWHYEWRFYIFHVWRTRVWVRTPTEPATPNPATQPSIFSTSTAPSAQ